MTEGHIRGIALELFSKFLGCGLIFLFICCYVTKIMPCLLLAGYYYFSALVPFVLTTTTTNVSTTLNKQHFSVQ